ncbi:MAG TPA: two-component regulator propeller domain-containing protein [Flavisolibacter sp.]|jgi:signal transduction histidine kinase/ligand-binding sensor domain-containing protein/DNA-binding response OmpR family regulator|nr:two-component regulator propeller domain-containing protein [Flavisolibacter sp.]
MKAKVFFLILFYSFALRCFSSDSLRVNYLGIEQGLSNNAVRCIYQDHLGFLWFGTYDGLNRYDGYAFKVFRNVIGNKTSLVDNHITAINADADHNIWIGTEKGLSLYNPLTANFSIPAYRNTSRSLVDLKNGIHVIQPINKGECILVGTQAIGLLVFEKNQKAGVQIPLQNSETNYEVTGIAYDSIRQLVWILSPQAGLCQYNIAQKKITVVDNTIKQADCLKADNNGNVWLGNENGLFCYEKNRKRFSTNVLASKYKVVGLFHDRQNTLWIASDGGGVWYLPWGSNYPLPYLSATGNKLVNSNVVYAIYEDDQKRKWIGTLRGGVNVIQNYSSSFKNIAYKEPGQDNTIDNFILSFCEDDKNNVWIGTDGAGMRYWNRKTNSFSKFVNNRADKNSISSNFVTSIIEDSQNDLWISTWFGSINRRRKNSNAFEHFSCINSQTGLEEHNAWLVYEDRQKRIWASTTNNGTLYIFNRNKNQFELFDSRLENIQCLSEDGEGNLWGGNYRALFRIDPVNKKHTSYNIGYTIRCVLEDRHKNFWIATDGGGLLLFNRKDGSYQRFTTQEGLPSNTILRLLEDRNNNLWLSTYNGLCKFNTSTRTSKNFSLSDGLQSNQFSFNAALALKDGEFLFGGIKGFNAFHPDSVFEKKQIPPIYLTEIKIDNSPIEQSNSYITKRSFERTEQIRLPYDKAIVSFEYLALEYSGTDKIKYAYKLEGWDKNWNYINNTRTVNYSRLREGNYTFKVKVMNADGVWSSETTLVRLIVIPPWYRTWWAYLLYVLALASVIYVYILYSKRQERLKYEIKLAHLEYEKEKEITEKKISFFTHISHEFRSPLTLIINPLKEIFNSKKEYVETKDVSMVYRNARRLLSLVDQLLLFRKVESIDQQLRVEKFDIVEACNEVFLSFLQHAVSRRIDFFFKKPEFEVLIYGDKEKIEIILFNLLSNAFKHTPADGTISLEVYEHDRDLEITVRDTGIGIPSETGDKIFDSFYQANNSQSGFGVGLYVSNKLAIAHQGSLGYTSKVGEGTEFRLKLLKGKAHFRLQPVSEDYKSSPTILQELVEPVMEADSVKTIKNKSQVIDKLTSNLPTMVVVDDDEEIRAYLKRIFSQKFNVYEAEDGTEAYTLVVKEVPDIVISDVMMRKMGGIELCKKIKENSSVGHIPVILLTASSSDEIKLKGIEGGADDYIMKPFDKEIVVARVHNILKGKSRLQQYFFDSATLDPTSNIPGEHKEFIETCISIVEKHLDDQQFTVEIFCREIGMSHAMLYKKVKRISGLTVNVFIRYIRLRKAAELLLTSDKTIVEVTYITGFSDVKYFREQFYKLFQMNPSEFIKKYRKALGAKSAKAKPPGD